ncbi:uncharacterized protein KQ657_002381 [Scheffersomyces spartinae]|uniref:glucan endo-1,3-beta-D-glucosidase n=1 Tax=Scheffersomyces spartinae TaxID=45513 RepID=A0A9P8ALE3_9ASCO|nr:uncharacterized protein KQ657_002381 [Scheffersomyces spartinae]KAG7195994.1 hypothetical protein KQ657_002381 [Scheffersomyces spartinae]
MGLVKRLASRLERLGVDPKQQEHSLQKPIDTPSGSDSTYNRPPAQIPPTKPQKVLAQPIDNGVNIFSGAIAEGDIPLLYPKKQHDVKPKGCSYGPSDKPIQTNNFYNNLTLEDQSFPIWPLPYSMWLSKEPGQVNGFALNHTDAGQRVFGPDPGCNPVQFYFNPPRIKSLVLSGEGICEDTVLELSNHQKMSVTGKMAVGSGSIVFPLVQGMGYVTAIYTNLKPIISSQVGIKEFSKCIELNNSTKKYIARLFNDVVWSVYVIGDSTQLVLQDPNTIVGDSNQSCTIQVCKGDSPYYDSSAGMYQTSVKLIGQVDGQKGTYSFAYETQGNSQSGKGMVWCLPHQHEVLDQQSNQCKTDLVLDSPTKGVMKAFQTNSLTMIESELPVDINWLPWSVSSKSEPCYSDSEKEMIRNAARAESQQDIVAMANIDSMYTSGKILDKFAYILYVCNDILQDNELTGNLLPRIKEAINIFASNKQKFPLVYDSTWKGLISSADPGADFGNSNYNDHHFHYGYHIHAIALVAHVDPSILTENNCLVRDYAITLLRDVATPNSNDKLFPESRSFDWFHGHSFAHGIFASGDGKDEESSSEDYHFAYGMKLFAKVIGDRNMEARANLMLSVMRRAMNKYMLFLDDNNDQPANFIGNKVAGISFENKIDFSTYFGRGSIANEWIHGIHMLPITPISSYIRSPRFVQEEWERHLQPIIDSIPDGWKGILMLNLALYDPKRSYQWFARSDWQDNLIDNGMSRTWSLAFTGGIGGSK